MDLSLTESPLIEGDFPDAAKADVSRYVPRRGALVTGTQRFVLDIEAVALEAGRVMSKSAHARIEAFWSKNLPTAAGDVCVGAHRGSLIGYPGVYAIQRSGRGIVSSPPDLVSAIANRAPAYDEVMSPLWWEDMLPDWVVLGPSVHSFLDDVRKLHADPLARRVTLAEVRQALALVVDADEWEEAGFDDSAVEHVWLLTGDDGAPVAAAVLTDFEGMPVDMGVIAAKGARGRGYGRRVAATAVCWAVQNHGIARWRALENNHPSRRLAVKLGFEDDARQLAVRPQR